MGVMYRNGSWYGVDSAEDYVLPIASKDILGGIRIGETLTIDEDGVLDVVDSGSDCECDNVGHFDRTTGTPTTGEIFNSYSGEIINKATGSYSHAEGSYSTASGTYSHAENLYTTASGNYSHAEGNYTFATGDGAHSEGKSTRAEGECSHAEGSSTTASTYQAHAEGLESTAGGNASHAEGYRTYAGNSYAHAEGEQTRATGLDSHTEGRKTEASAEQAHAEGLETKALDPGCHAEGYYTIAGAGNENNSAYAAHAEGNYSKAEANYTHAEGDHSEAKNTASHAEGYYTKATGIYTHAEGFNTIAEGAYSHAQGSYITAKGESQFAAGKYNIADSTSAVIIGGGTGESNRKNIFTIDWNGNIEAGVRDADGNITYGTINGVDITQIEGGGSGGDNPPYELPIASETELGGVKIGNGLKIDDDGTLNVIGGNSSGGGNANVGVKSDVGLNVSIEPNGGELGPDLIKLSYIRNNADAYIATDYIPKPNTRVVIDYSVNPGFIRDDQALFGSRRSSSGDQFVCWSGKRSTTDNQMIIFVYAGNTASSTGVPGERVFLPMEVGTRINADVSKYGVYINGELAHSVIDRGTPSPYPICFFACGTNATGSSTAYSAGSFTIYHAQIYEDNELIHDYIPAYHATKGPGLYDAIDKKFFGSANNYTFAYDSSYVGKDAVLYNVNLAPATGVSIGGVKPGNGLSVSNDGTLNITERIITGVDIDFTAEQGLRIYETSEQGFVVPEGYSLISYIENPSTAYARLDYHATSNTRVVARASFKQGKLDGNGVVFGSRAGTSNKEYVLWVRWLSYDTYPLLRFANGTQGWSSINNNQGIPIEGYNEYQVVTLETIPTDGLYVDGVKIQECTGGTFDATSYQFDIGHLSGESYSAEPLRIHGVQIYEGTCQVFNLIPVLNPDNIAGLYDTIKNKFYGSYNSTRYTYDESSVDTVEIEKKIALLPATNNAIGGVKVSESAGLQVNESGELDLKIKIVPCTQEQYDALTEKDPNTLYLIGD